MPEVLAVPYWPAVARTSLSGGRLLVTALETPHTTDRSEARRQVRTVLRELLAGQLACPAADIRLLSVPGQALRLAGAHHAISLSVSHEPGMSLAAMFRGGRVGVDLMRVPGDSEWQHEIDCLANDYLGPENAARLAAIPAAGRATTFAESWTGLEARLKCQGLGLVEWSPALESVIAGCQVLPLKLPAPYVGSLVVAPVRGGGNPGA